MNIPDNIILPDIPGNILLKAAETLQLCSKDPIPDKGFPFPYIAPGGAYGMMWWQLDFSIALAGMRHFDHTFCRNGLLNFITGRKENGRIPLWGNDRLPMYNGERMQREDVSSLPKLFDAAWKIAGAEKDREYLLQILDLLAKYLDWFKTARYDEKTGLFSAVFEETFIPYFGFAGEYAPVDLNAELLHGFICTAEIAGFCSMEKLAGKLLAEAEKLRFAMRRYLWNPEQETFSARNLKNNLHDSRQTAAAFAALRHGVPDEMQKTKLITRMLDQERFNWNKLPLASVDMTDTAFAAITTRQYFGNPCWSGDVWALTNENAVRGLLDCGEEKLAAELAVRTVQAFGSTFCEFMNPLTGDPCGVLNYAWTAGYCADLIFSVIFGIEYDAWKQKIEIAPVFPVFWHGKAMALDGAVLPDGSSLNIKVRCGNEAEIEAEIKKPDGKTIKIQGKNRLIIPL